MPAQITITNIAFDWPAAATQIVVISHKLAAAPDSSFVVDTTTQPVLPGGALDPAYVITPLNYGTWYTVRIAPACGDGAVAYKTLLTGVSPCPDILNVYGTVF